MATNLDARSPEFLLVQDARIRARDLYAGADRIKNAGETYLFKGENETTKDYEERKKRASFDPWAEVIVETRQALLFRKEAKREIRGRARAILENVDLQGTRASVFFERVQRDAQVSGLEWVLVNRVGLAPAEDGSFPSISRAEEEGMGLRPYLVHLPGESVIRTGRDQDGELLWAVVEIEREIPSTSERPWEAERLTRREWHVWTRSEWFVYTREETPAGGSSTMRAEGTSLGGANGSRGTADFTLESQGTHDVGKVPLVPFYGTYDRPGVGWPVFDKAASHIIKHYNQTSDGDWYLRLSGHPIPVVTGANEVEELDVGGGLLLTQNQGDPTPQAFYLEPSGAAFDAFDRAILRTEQRIMRISIRQSLNESRQIASAETQREDKRALHSSLQVVSIRGEGAEREVWALVSAWEMEEGVVHAIAWNRDFTDEMVEASMVDALGRLGLQGVLSKETIREILQSWEVLPPELQLDDEAGRIENELEREARATAPFRPATTVQDGNGSTPSTEGAMVGAG